MTSMQKRCYRNRIGRLMSDLIMAIQEDEAYGYQKILDPLIFQLESEVARITLSMDDRADNAGVNV